MPRQQPTDKDGRAQYGGKLGTVAITDGTNHALNCIVRGAFGSAPQREEQCSKPGCAANAIKHPRDICASPRPSGPNAILPQPGAPLLPSPQADRLYVMKSEFRACRAQTRSSCRRHFPY
jgi:hypothetical protein